jgi:hypothetical protein
MYAAPANAVVPLLRPICRGGGPIPFPFVYDSVVISVAAVVTANGGISRLLAPYGTAGRTTLALVITVTTTTTTTTRSAATLPPPAGSSAKKQKASPPAGSSADNAIVLA